MLSPSARLNLGYVLRSRQTSATAWDHDHIALVNLFYAPVIPPLLATGEADLY